MKRFSLVIAAVVIFGSLGYVAVRTNALNQFFGRQGQSANSAADPSRTFGPTSNSSPTATTTSPSAAAGTSAGIVPGAVPAASTSTGSVPLTGSTGNIAAADVGGHVEQLTGAYGPGFFGSRLIDGLAEPVWKAIEPVTFPQEIVFAFYDHQPALISAVVVVLPADGSGGPKDVEVWISAEGPTGKFTKVAAQTLAGSPIEQTIAIPATEARYVKLRVLSGVASDRLNIAEVRILEAQRSGYTPLAARFPDVATWKRSPRAAAQLGLDWLQQAAVEWQKEHKCFGCHVQAQVLMGLAVATKHQYSVSGEAFSILEQGTREYQDKEGSWFGGAISATQFGAMGLTQVDETHEVTEDRDFLRGVDFLVARQPQDGGMVVDRDEVPIVQGRFMTSANSLVALMRAHEITKNAKYRTSADRALAWVAANRPETTQDKVFKILALSRFGTPEQKRVMAPVLGQLITEQQPDGGWKERAAGKGSNAFATGQVLYALKEAGASTRSSVFARGVRYLLDAQVHDTHLKDDGTWPATNSDTDRPSNFAPTMWAVIALTGSYGTATTGGLQVVTKLQREKPPSRNLEIILDASGSMKLPLGKSTRWQTALQVLEQLVNTLPDDFNVGLRVYGHRYSSRSPQTCSDSELVVPIGKLDRQRILASAKQVRPRGETPLIRSVLVSTEDLKPLGNGSVILITDGEESCHGDPKKAADDLKTSGVDVTLSIVGFTLTGQVVERELGTLARSTGGRYYSAQSGDELARALMVAAAQTLPYDVYDGSGRLVSSEETSALGTELSPGAYRVVVHALGQELEESVKIVADRSVVLTVSLDGDRFVINR
jgi:hypothetical protein